MAVFKNPKGKFCVQFNRMNKKFWMGSYDTKSGAEKKYRYVLSVYATCCKDRKEREVRMRILADVANAFLM